MTFAQSIDVLASTVLGIPFCFLLLWLIYEQAKPTAVLTKFWLLILMLSVNCLRNLVSMCYCENEVISAPDELGNRNNFGISSLFFFSTVELQWLEH